MSHSRAPPPPAPPPPPPQFPRTLIGREVKPGSKDQGAEGTLWLGWSQNTNTCLAQCTCTGREEKVTRMRTVVHKRITEGKENSLMIGKISITRVSESRHAMNNESENAKR